MIKDLMKKYALSEQGAVDYIKAIAAGVAVNWKLRHKDNTMKIIFDTFLDADAKIYENILKMI